MRPPAQSPQTPGPPEAPKPEAPKRARRRRRPPPEPFRVFDPGEPIEPLADRVEQWLQWEQQANLVGFRVSTQPVEIEVAWVPRGALDVRVAPGAPDVLLRRFLREGQVCFPRHPLNEDPSVAHDDAPAVERWTARFTSSRTLAVPGEPLFSLKLATDYPHPDFHQPEKTKLREEATDAVQWVTLLHRVDQRIGPDPRVDIVREALAVLVPGSETCFLVRDLRLFQDDRYRLPALSIPWVGRQIARRHGAAFEAFWADHYAELVGRAKARLFLRAGLQFATPNPQNLLVELDASLLPTGKIVIRDLGDADCATDALNCLDRELPWTQLRVDLKPETAISFWAFDEAGAHGVDAASLAQWRERHDRGYRDELARAFPGLAPRGDLPFEAVLAHWNERLRDPRAVARFRRIASGA
jgi:hypothetical protein